VNDNFNFLITKEETFLNFGSFGSCPKEIFDFYQKLQIDLETQPVEFIVDKANELFKNVRSELGEFLKCSSDDLVLMTNPSYAINTIAKSIELNFGEEILSTNLEYGSLIETWKRTCQISGSRFRQSNISFPIEDKESFIEEFWSGYNEKTKAIFLSHITSSTALILPIEEICKEAKKRGLITIVDGAHAPGQLDVNLSNKNIDIYVGACHKWMMAPKGSSFLYASKEAQNWIEPLVVSWGAIKSHRLNNKFIDDHQTNGTRDLSALLCIGKSIEFMRMNNWTSISNTCRDIAIEFAKCLREEFQFKPIAPIEREWVGQMFAIPILCKKDVDLRFLIKENYKIEIPITLLNEDRFLRYSFQVFNDMNDLNNLRDAIRDLEKKKLVSFYRQD
jgi:isopenicillin-N epimerase